MSKRISLFIDPPQMSRLDWKQIDNPFPERCKGHHSLKPIGGIIFQCVSCEAFFSNMGLIKNLKRKRKK